MSIMKVPRNQKICAPCRFWNGAIGSTSLEILLGGNLFEFDSSEKHSCFKKGRGMITQGIQNCSYFMPRYED